MRGSYVLLYFSTKNSLSIHPVLLGSISHYNTAYQIPVCWGFGLSTGMMIPNLATQRLQLLVGLIDNGLNESVESNNTEDAAHDKLKVTEFFMSLLVYIGKLIY